MESSGCPVHTQGHHLESAAALLLLGRGNWSCETQAHHCCLKALVGPPAPQVGLPFSSQKSNFYFLSQLQSRLSSSAGDTGQTQLCWAGIQCSVRPLSAWEVLLPSVLIPDPRSWQELFQGTKSGISAVQILLPSWCPVVSLAAGVCQKHVLHLLPGMSSDSDIECDTENEEQEDATSPSEMFNQAFSVQPSSEGRAAEPLFPDIPSLPGAPRMQIPGGAVEVLKLQVPVRFGTLGIPIKTAQNRRGKLLLALRSQFR